MSRILITTLDINYDREITAITFPFMRELAKTLSADFHVQTTRLFPKLPVSVEKFYLFDISENYDIIVFIDADAIPNPFPTTDGWFSVADLLKLIESDDDPIILVPEHIDAPHQYDSALVKFQCPLYFSIFTHASRMAFHPFWIEENIDPMVDLVKYINPKDAMHTHYELSKKVVTKPEWFMDELLYNMNITKHAIPSISIKQTFGESQTFFAHTAAEREAKLRFLKQSVESLELWRETLS